MVKVILFHRHQQQLTDNQIIDLAKVRDTVRHDWRMPALKPTLCPDFGGTPKPDDLPCHFPFEFKNETYTTCVEDWDKRAWCATKEGEYDGVNWRYCRDGDNFPEVIPCFFPYKYEGQYYKSCTADKAHKPWCSLIPKYDYSKYWRYCREVNVTRPDVKVRTIQEAERVCRQEGRFLAMLRDLEAMAEMGTSACQCGWMSGGVAVTVVSRKAGCPKVIGRRQDTGVHVCWDSRSGFRPFCVQ